MELFQSLLQICESQDPDQKKKTLIVSKEIKKVTNLKSDDDDLNKGTNFRFLYRPKYDIYPALEQDDPQKLRELHKVYSMFGADRERGFVYGIDNSSKDYTRVLKYLSISTDGSISLERIKRAGFASAGRVNVKRVYRRGDFIIIADASNSEDFIASVYTINPKQEEE